MTRRHSGPNTRYDVILAGGGAAGLSLAYHLHQAFPDLSMLIVDEQLKDRNDHTWCYWGTEPSYTDGLAYRTWDRLAVRNADEELILDLAPYRYRMVRALDFYRFMRGALAGEPGIQFVQGTIRDISSPPARGRPPVPHNDSDMGSRAQVIVSDQEHYGGFAEVIVNQIAYRSRWVFDSRYRAADYRPLTHRYHYLIQHFVGWEIETDEAVFDPALPTMFDFRTPQHGSMRFFYVLPYSDKRGLVEYTVFSQSLLPAEDYQKALQGYLQHRLGVSGYQILEEERDMIPMTDHPHRRQAGLRVLNIGTRGGRVKPSSGYAFRRIQEDAAAITRSMVEHGHPFALPESPGRYRTFDAMLLQILRNHGGLGASIFMRLFRRNPVQRVFRFLDEEDGLGENLRLMATVPAWPFIRAWLRVKLLMRS